MCPENGRDRVVNSVSVTEVLRDRPILLYASKIMSKRFGVISIVTGECRLSCRIAQRSDSVYCPIRDLHAILSVKALHVRERISSST